MVHFNKFSPSIFGLYAFTVATYSWFIPNVKAQDDGLGKSLLTYKKKCRWFDINKKKKKKMTA